MPPDFARETLNRLPLAEAALQVWHHVCDPEPLQELYDRHRQACQTRKIAFADVVQLIRDALLEHGGSGRKSFQHARQQGDVPVTDQAIYGKLARMPATVTEAFLRESSQRLSVLLPTADVHAVPASLQRLRLYVLDGKVVKKIPKRLRPLRGRRGSVLGGKGLAALDVRRGVVVALATAADGETNEAKLVSDVLAHVRLLADEERLFIVDSQFCDLTQPWEFLQDGDHFLARYHPKNQFHADPARPRQTYQDAQGRTVHQEWGWLGRPGHKRRLYVRRITLERPDEKPIILVTDLLDEQCYPADDLLTAYLLRWGVECVFQQITEVFHLEKLIGTTPQGTLFQLAFCLLLYNVIQLVRAYVAQGQHRDAATISSEMLFDDVRRDLVALHEVLTVGEIEPLFAPLTPAQLRRRLHQLLSPRWSPLWEKAKKKKWQTHPKREKASSEHTSVYRILEECRGRKKGLVCVT